MSASLDVKTLALLREIKRICDSGGTVYLCGCIVEANGEVRPCADPATCVRAPTWQ